MYAKTWGLRDFAAAVCLSVHASIDSESRVNGHYGQPVCVLSVQTSFLCRVVVQVQSICWSRCVQASIDSEFWVDGHYGHPVVWRASVPSHSSPPLPLPQLVGSYYAPIRIVVDPDVLQTLEDWLLPDGMGEIVKHALCQVVW